uniref:Uncharacterized protein n=1 Tax=Romanomermis culicivorax TaxID=13658 RepID=A0A915JXL2_ROMCU
MLIAMPYVVNDGVSGGDFILTLDIFVTSSNGGIFRRRATVKKSIKRLFSSGAIFFNDDVDTDEEEEFS